MGRQWIRVDGILFAKIEFRYRPSCLWVPQVKIARRRHAARTCPTLADQIAFGQFPEATHLVLAPGAITLQ